MAIRRRLLAAAAEIKKILHTITSATGLVSFTTGLAEPVESLVCAFTPVQSGSGDPSPTNIRPIAGWAGIKVYRSTLPDGYKRLKDITFDGAVHYESSVYLLGSDVVTMTITPGLTTGMNVFGCYSGTGSSARNFSFFNYQNTSQNAYFRYGTVLLRPNWGTTATRTVSFGAGGTSGFRTNVETSETSFTTTDPAWIGMLPNSNSSHFTGTITGSIKVGNRLEFIPCERVSDGAIGYYDTLNGTFLAPVGTGTPTTSGYDGEVVDVDWTSEAGTVYCGNLNVTTGVLTVDRANFDAYANKSKFAQGSGNVYILGANFNPLGFVYPIKTSLSFSSHFKPLSSSSSSTPSFAIGNTGIFAVNGATGITDTPAHWIAYLEDQIAAGTPVQFVLPLRSPRTFQLTPAEVATLKGGNTIWHSGNGAITVGYYDKQ